MMAIDLRFYVTDSGNSPVERYLSSLGAPQRAFFLDILRDVRVRGFAASGVQVRQIEGKLWELKIARHRVFYVQLDATTLVLLHAYKKQSWKAPRREIEVALARMREVLHG